MKLLIYRALVLWIVSRFITRTFYRGKNQYTRRFDTNVAGETRSQHILPIKLKAKKLLIRRAAQAQEPTCSQQQQSDNLRKTQEQMSNDLQINKPINQLSRFEGDGGLIQNKYSLAQSLNFKPASLSLFECQIQRFQPVQVSLKQLNNNRNFQNLWSKSRMSQLIILYIINSFIKNVGKKNRNRPSSFQSFLRINNTGKILTRAYRYKFQKKVQLQMSQKVSTKLMPSHIDKKSHKQLINARQKCQKQNISQPFTFGDPENLIYKNTCSWLTLLEKDTSIQMVGQKVSQVQKQSARKIPKNQSTREKHVDDRRAASQDQPSKSQNMFYFRRSQDYEEQAQQQQWNQTLPSKSNQNRKSFIISSKPTDQSQQDRKIKGKPYPQQMLQSQISIIPSLDTKHSLQDYRRCTGLTQSVWYDKYGRVQSVGYATGFAISPRIIVSCAHSVFQVKKGRACDKIYFVPFHGNTPLSKPQDIYQSEDQNFLRFQELATNQNFSRKPIAKDYSVFILKTPYHTNCYFQLSDKPLAQNEQLAISGYPSKQYSLTTPLVNFNFQRKDLQGRFENSKKGFILVHNMPTQGGHSGSPIIRLAENGQQSIKVVGIHTHKGRNSLNEGLAITSKLKKKIIKFSQQLAQIHGLGYNEMFASQRYYNDVTSEED